MTCVPDMNSSSSMAFQTWYVMYSFIFTLGWPANSRKSEAGNTEATSAGEAEVSPLILSFLAHQNKTDRVDIDIPVLMAISDLE